MPFPARRLRPIARFSCVPIQYASRRDHRPLQTQGKRLAPSVFACLRAVAAALSSKAMLTTGK